jgi:hypothetical protein
MNGVEGGRSASITVVRDTTPPALTITTPTPGATLNGGSVTVTGKTDKDIDVQVRNETTGTIESGRSTAKGAFSIGITLRNGTNLLTITATDQAGNPITKSVEISTSASVGRISIILNPGTIILSSRKDFLITAAATDSTGAPAANVQVCMYVSAPGAQPSTPVCVISDVNGRAAWTYTLPNNFNTQGSGFVTVSYELSIGDPLLETQNFRVYRVKP